MSHYMRNRDSCRADVQIKRYCDKRMKWLRMSKRQIQAHAAIGSWLVMVGERPSVVISNLDEAIEHAARMRWISGAVDIAFLGNAWLCPVDVAREAGYDWIIGEIAANELQQRRSEVTPA